MPPKNTPKKAATKTTQKPGPLNIASAATAAAQKALKRSLGSTPLLDIFLDASSATESIDIEQIIIFGHRSQLLQNGLSHGQNAELNSIYKQVTAAPENEQFKTLHEWLYRTSLALFQIRVRHEADPYSLTSPMLDGVYAAMAATTPSILGNYDENSNPVSLKNLTDTIMAKEPMSLLGQHIALRQQAVPSPFTYAILGQLMRYFPSGPLILKSSTPHNCSILLTSSEQTKSPPSYTLATLRELLTVQHGIIAHVGSSANAMIYYSIPITDKLMEAFTNATKQLITSILEKLRAFVPQTTVTERIHMPGDGNCAFHAMHYAVTGARLSSDQVYSLRLQIGLALYDSSAFLERLSSWLQLGYTIGAITAFLCERNCWEGCIAEEIVSLLAVYYDVLVTIQSQDYSYNFDASTDPARRVILAFTMTTDGAGASSNHYDVFQPLPTFDLHRSVRPMVNEVTAKRLLESCTMHERSIFKTYDLTKLRPPVITWTEETTEDDAVTMTDGDTDLTDQPHRVKRRNDGTERRLPTQKVNADPFFIGINPMLAAPLDRIAATVWPEYGSTDLIISDLPIAAMTDTPQLLERLLTSAMEAWQFIAYSDLSKPNLLKWIYNDTARRFGAVHIKLPISHKVSHYGDKKLRVYPGTFTWTSPPQYAHVAEKRQYLKKKVAYRLHGRLAHASSIRGHNLGRVFVVRGLSPHCNVLTMQLRALHHYLLLMIQGYRFDIHPHTLFRPDGSMGKGPIQDLVASVYLYSDEMHSPISFIQELYTNMGFDKNDILVDVPIFGMSFHFYKNELSFPINFGERPIFHFSPNVMHLTGFPRRSASDLTAFLMETSGVQLQDLELALLVHGEDSDRDTRSDELILIWRNRSQPLSESEWSSWQTFALLSVIQYKNPKIALTDYVPYRSVTGDLQLRKRSPPTADPSWQLVVAKQKKQGNNKEVVLRNKQNTLDFSSTDIIAKMTSVVATEVEKALTSSKILADIKADVISVQRANEESAYRFKKIDEQFAAMNSQTATLHSQSEQTTQTLAMIMQTMQRMMNSTNPPEHE